MFEKWNAVVFETNGFEKSVAVAEGAIASNIEVKFGFFDV
jgi:hypothetical protein